MTVAVGDPYGLLPFTFRRRPHGRVLVVSQAGETLFLDEATFAGLVECSLDPKSAVAQDLVSRNIIYDGSPDTAINLLATQLRTRKAYLHDFTGLHMIVLTVNCNGACSYCHASAGPAGDVGQMTPTTARRVVETIFASPSPEIKIEFQGGEPMLNEPVLRLIVEEAERLNKRARKGLQFVLCTNLLDIGEDSLRFLKRHQVAVSSSLDGPPDLHDRHRQARQGGSAHARFVANLERVREYLGPDSCSPLLTVTADNLPRLRDVVDEYARLGLGGVFIRPLNPFGRAAREWAQLGYGADAFATAYCDALSYIIERNKQGLFFPEFYATLLLTRILTPFSTGFVDLQSPTAAGIGGAVYDHDGTVYPTDEARMLARTGDRSFALGNVHRDSYADMFLGQKLRELVRSTCLECQPGCADCAYALFCGVDPIRNYVETGSVVGHQPTSEVCQVNTAVLDYLFERLLDDDPQTSDVFWSWVLGRPLAEVRA